MCINKLDKQYNKLRFKFFVEKCVLNSMFIPSGIEKKIICHVFIQKKIFVLWVEKVFLVIKIKTNIPLLTLNLYFV